MEFIYGVLSGACFALLSLYIGLMLRNYHNDNETKSKNEMREVATDIFKKRFENYKLVQDKNYEIMRDVSHQKYEQLMSEIEELKTKYDSRN